MALLQINLLGGFSVVADHQPITKFRSAKSRALLAYLATQPDRDHARTTLATLLWGDLPDSAAMTNLRIELSNLNKVLASHSVLTIERNTVCFHSALATVDVVTFREAVTDFLALSPESQITQLASLVTALDLYRGEFLAGFHLGDALEFDEWQVLTQEQLHEQAMQALNRLQQRYAEQGNWTELATSARRQLTLVPWQETAHRNLIQALAAQGQRAAALEQYAKCYAVLQAELGVEPALATQEIAARLRNYKADGSIAQPKVARNNLAQQVKSLVGRSGEIEHIYRLVQREPLVTLVGLGGVGKSRLALAVAQKALHDFADGIWFVALANIEATDNVTDRIALAIAAAIDFAVTDMQAPLTELAAHLVDKELLLVLDNWDQITTAAEALCEQLLALAGVHILATSRVRLQVEGEILIPLAGLPISEAFTLFGERARRLVPTFAGTEHAAAIYKICEEVGGLPLGIELAASWVEHIGVAEIGRSLAEIAVEPAQANSLVDRHQTLHAVFEYSWRLLSLHQQQILARLSAFRGGFDRAAAAAVASSNLSDLSLLIAHSLVQRVNAGRYDLHPLVQEFTARKLDPAAAPVLFGAYSHYYLTLLTSTEQTQRAALRADFDNMRSAWQRAMLAADGELMQQSAERFGEFIAQFGLVSDGNQLFADAVACFDSIPQQQEVVAHLLDQQARFLRALHGLRAISLLQQRVLTLTEDPKLQARAHLDLANYHAEQGEWAEADFHFDHAEALVQASSDVGSYIVTVEERIHINAIHFRGDFAQGIARLEEMLQLLDRATTPILDAESIRFRILQSLPLIATRQRDYGLAIRYAKATVAHAQAIAHRQRECFSLLDLALAEQFAGLYAQAVAHNQAALTIAEEIGDNDEIALLKANFCLTLRQQGELALALAYGQAAIESLRKLGNRRIEGQARNRVGHTLMALERWADADVAYAEAQAVWAPTQHPNRYEAMAGRAVAVFYLGRQDEALRLVNEVLAFVAVSDLAGIVEPVLLLLNCETVLTGLGRNVAARQVLTQAATWVQTVAGRISDEAVRAAFLHNRPDNQLLQARIALAEAIAPARAANASDR